MSNYRQFGYLYSFASQIFKILTMQIMIQKMSKACCQTQFSTLNRPFSLLEFSSVSSKVLREKLPEPLEEGVGVPARVKTTLLRSWDRCGKAPPGYGPYATVMVVTTYRSRLYEKTSRYRYLLLKVEYGDCFLVDYMYPNKPTQERHRKWKLALLTMSLVFFQGKTTFKRPWQTFTIKHFHQVCPLQGARLPKNQGLWALPSVANGCSSWCPDQGKSVRIFHKQITSETTMTPAKNSKHYISDLAK